MNRDEIRAIVLGESDLSEAERAGKMEQLVKDGHYAVKVGMGEIKEADPDKHELTFVINTDTVDRDSERILPRSFERDLKYYLSSPVVMWAHNYREPAVGRMMSYEITDKEFTAVDRFAVKENPLAATLWNLYSADPPFMKATSVGFIPLEVSHADDDKLPGQQRGTYKRNELIEHSLVPIGSNRLALRKAWNVTKGWDPVYVKEIEKLIELPDTRDCGHKAWYDHDGTLIDPCPVCEAAKAGRGKPEERLVINLQSEAFRKALSETIEAALKAAGSGDDGADDEVSDKNIVSYQNLPTAAPDMAWSFNAADGNAVLGDPPDWTRYKRAHIFFDPAKSEVKEGYKLPIAKMIGGQLRVVRRGVFAAMGALLGARGGVDIPDRQRRSAYNHLRRYYQKFGDEPPEFRSVEDTQRLLALLRNLGESTGNDQVDLADLLGRYNDLAFAALDEGFALPKAPTLEELSSLLKCYEEAAAKRGVPGTEDGEGGDPGDDAPGEADTKLAEMEDQLSKLLADAKSLGDRLRSNPLSNQE